MIKEEGGQPPSRLFLIYLIPLLSLFLLSLIGSVEANRIKMDTSKTIPKSKDVAVGGMSMLELSTRPWLYSLSQKYGRDISRLQDVPDEELQDIVNQNFTMLWMMG